MAEHTLRTIEAINEFQRRLNAKSTVLFTNSVVVKKSEFLDLLETIKRNLPEELEKCQALMQEVASIKLRTETAAKDHLKEAERQAKEILDDAASKADEMVSKAKVLSAELVDQHYIVESARDYARKLEMQAQKNAHSIHDMAYQTSMNSLQALMSDVDHIRSSIQQTMRRIDEKNPKKRP